LHVDVLEEFLEGPSFECLVSIHAVATRKNHDKAAPALENLVGINCLLKLIILNE